MVEVPDARRGVRRVPQVAEHPHAAGLDLRGLRVLVLVDHVLVDGGGVEPVGLLVHPRGDERGQVEAGVPVEHHLVQDDLVGRLGQHRLVGEAVPRDVDHPGAGEAGEDASGPRLTGSSRRPWMSAPPDRRPICPDPSVGAAPRCGPRPPGMNAGDSPAAGEGPPAGRPSFCAMAQRTVAPRTGPGRGFRTPSTPRGAGRRARRCPAPATRSSTPGPGAPIRSPCSRGRASPACRSCCRSATGGWRPRRSPSTAAPRCRWPATSRAPRGPG